MSTVEFDNNHSYSSRQKPTKSESGAVSAIKKLGFAKTEGGAKRILVIVSILVIVAAGVIIARSLSGPSVPPEARENPEYGVPMPD